jgi:hypothetical protein
MYRDKFVLSVIQDGRPVKETGDRWKKEVSIPFDSEYKIRLKNKNDRSCTARVFIDGKKVSQLGDVIVTAGGTIDLERYIDRSLVQGKKFKFVPLDHPDVDDPTSSSNGIIEVEFRKAKQANGIKIDYSQGDFVWRSPYKEDNNGPQWVYNNDNTTEVMGDDVSDAVIYSASTGAPNFSNGGVVKSKSFRSFVSAGATVEGSKSNQQFIYSSLEVENSVVLLKLKIVGIEKRDTMRNTKYRYCAQCGQRVKRIDKYCSECGHRI